jgi:hypothetical protein
MMSFAVAVAVIVIPVALGDAGAGQRQENRWKQKISEMQTNLHGGGSWLQVKLRPDGTGKR